MTATGISELEKDSVSVVIPFHNRIDLLLQAIKSVLAQTYKNIEILLVDDWSTENLEELTQYIKPHRNIRYCRQENGWPAKARNLGVRISNSKYVAFLDSDDFFLPEKIEVQLKYMIQEWLVFSHTSYEIINQKSEAVRTVHSWILKWNLLPKIITDCPIATPTVMGLRSIFEKTPFIEEFRIGEDVCLWIDIAGQYFIWAIDQPLTRVRVIETTTAYDPKKQAVGQINIAKHILNSPSLKDYKDYADYLFMVAQMALSWKTQPRTMFEKIFNSVRYLGIRKTFRLIWNRKNFKT